MKGLRSKLCNVDTDQGALGRRNKLESWEETTDLSLPIMFVCSSSSTDIEKSLRKAFGGSSSNCEERGGWRQAHGCGLNPM
uniref:Uncharacterized protein n=1 Tax=Solanum lycopersicum TaxID=4081 RepID=A0A3Q7EPN8_SOLLC